MIYYKKYFPFVDILQTLKAERINKTTQLFIISLIAHYHEQQRVRGNRSFDENISQDLACYEVKISEKQIEKKFGFCKDLIIKIKREIKMAYDTKKVKINIEFLEIDSESRESRRHHWFLWGLKDQSRLDRYSFKIKTQGRNTIDIPTKVIYDRHREYSQKMAAVWNISLKKRLGRQPKMMEIERESGISERTVRKAKKKYPSLFI